MKKQDLGKLRAEMVRYQLAARAIHQRAVLQAMASVPRENFVPDDLQHLAYADMPLPIGQEQTISQPYIVALMTEALNLTPQARVLEIGTGSGYAAAVLSRIASEVYTVERHQALAQQALERFQSLGYENINVLHGDGTLGWPEHAPYDGIVVTAGGPHIPEPLLAQLVVGGRLVIPVGQTLLTQDLIRLTRTAGDNYRRESLGGVRFVPLVGEAGWQE